MQRAGCCWQQSCPRPPPHYIHLFVLCCHCPDLVLCTVTSSVPFPLSHSHARQLHCQRPTIGHQRPTRPIKATTSNLRSAKSTTTSSSRFHLSTQISSSSTSIAPRDTILPLSVIAWAPQCAPSSPSPSRSRFSPSPSSYRHKRTPYLSLDGGAHLPRGVFCLGLKRTMCASSPRR